MRKIRLHPSARTELRHAVDWYSSEAGFTVAAAFVDDYEHLQDLIRAHPLIGHGGVCGTRTLAFKAHPYTLVYRSRNGIIEIIAVAHSSRLPRDWVSRL